MQRAARGFLVVVSVLNGLAALVCGALFLISPDGSLMGFEPLVSVVQTLPMAEVFFRDLRWIGIAMLLVLAIPNIGAALALFRCIPAQYRATLLAAALLMLWCAFEIAFMFNVAAVGYFAVGLLSALVSILLLRRPARAAA
jgi:hypothetical protein